MSGELDRLRDLESQFVLGCWNWYRLWVWQRHQSFDTATVEERIRIAEEVLATAGRGGIAWAQGGWLYLIEYLLGRLGHEDPHVRSEAAVALGDLDHDGGRVVPVLLDRVQSPEVTPQDRACAAWALGRIGRGRNDIVPILLGVLRYSASQPDSDELRRCAAEAIEALTDDGEVLLAVARLCLLDQFYKCKLIGLSLVECLGERGRDLLPLVEPLRNDEVEQVRAAARRIMIDLL